MIVYILKKYQHYQVYRLFKVFYWIISKNKKDCFVIGAIVAKPQPFDCHDIEVCGADIFQKLVPLVIIIFDKLKKKRF